MSSNNEKCDVCPPREYQGLKDIVYFNNGDGTFRDATEEIGLVDAIQYAVSRKVGSDDACNCGKQIDLVDDFVRYLLGGDLPGPAN